MYRLRARGRIYLPSGRTDGRSEGQETETSLDRFPDGGGDASRGIREAKDLSSYDNLANSAYLRAKEDYLMGINFSRVLTLRYGNSVSSSP